MVSEGPKMVEMLEGAQMVVPQVVTSHLVRLIPLHGSKGNTMHEDPAPGSRAGRAGGSESQSSEHVAKQLKKKFDD